MYRLTALPTYLLAVLPSRRNDTPLPIGGYLAEFVRLKFTITKDGTWIDDFTCCPRHRDRRR
jgi:hypothetical protein